MAYFMSIRPINLFIIGCTQILVYYLFFHSSNMLPGQQWVLEPPKIFIFTLVTMCIAASGYLINDYVDFDSDIVNSKKHRLERKHDNLRFYVCITLIGFLVSVWFALDMNKPMLSLIYVLSVASLFFYSTHLKKTVLLGNVVVSLFSSGVLGILLFAENSLLNQQMEAVKSHIYSSVLLFCLFAFLVSMVREIVKDVEDVHGDKINGYRTLPVNYGIGISRKIAFGFTLIILVMLLYVLFKGFQSSDISLITYLIGGLILPVCLIGYMLTQPSFEENANRISKWCKLLMLSGLILLIIVH